MLAVTSLLAARGRSLARLIEGLSDGDPAAWMTLGGIVVVLGIIFAVKNMRGRE